VVGEENAEKRDRDAGNYMTDAMLPRDPTFRNHTAATH
jgi:hypothetical protein